MGKFCLVQLTPKDMRCQESINLGFEIIKNKVLEYGWEVDTVKFGEKINAQEYDIIGFNIFYVAQQLNLIPFLKENNIEPRWDVESNRPLLIAGGQGVQNPLPLSKFIDIFVIGDGEILIEKILKNYEDGTLMELAVEDGIYYSCLPSEITFSHIDSINQSEPIIYQKRGMIELTRGCKYRCKFCQYSWTNGKYREKDFEIVGQLSRGEKR
jgi:radical SAM superfamily enzyme YgiQ (UPF0313 family)